MYGPDTLTAAAPTVRAVLAAAASTLGKAGIADAGNDGRHLLAAVLGLSAAQLLAAPERALTGDEARRFAEAVMRRAAREPVSRIAGEREFYGRTFKLTPATLDPRPDSETLIEAALGFVRSEGLQTAPLRILDVGTGTGCLLLTLLCELPDAAGLGTDISPAALDTARENATRLGVSQRATWLAADGLENVDGPFDILVCNPPYIRSDDIATLEPEVRAFDPRAALDGGADGLDIYRRLAPWMRCVVPDGLVLFEVGHDQADAVAGVLASSAGISNDLAFTFHYDVAGIRRCVACRTRGRA